MIKLALLLFVIAGGFVGGLVYAPFIPAAVYHGLAVFRPQFLWQDSLNAYVGPDFPLSLVVALSAIVATIVARISLIIAPRRFPGVAVPALNPGHFLMALFAGWVTVTYLNGEKSSLAVEQFGNYQKIFVMYFITALAMMSVRQAWIMYLIIALSLSYIASELNQIYYLNGQYNFIARNGFGGLDNNGAALQLAIGVPLCIYAWDGIRHWIRWIFPISTILLLHAVLLSYSRGAMLSLLVTSPLYLLRCRNKKLILAAYAAAVLLVPLMASEEIVNRFSSIGEHESDGSAISRKTTWIIAIQMATERPIFGFGVRNSANYTYQYGADIQGRVIHSTYLQIAADSGFVGLGFYLLFLGGAILYANRARRAVKELADHDDDARRIYTISCGVEGSLLVFAVGCAFLSMETFEQTYILALLGVQIWSLAQLRPRCVT